MGNIDKVPLSYCIKCTKAHRPAASVGRWLAPAALRGGVNGKQSLRELQRYFVALRKKNRARQGAACFCDVSVLAVHEQTKMRRNEVLRRIFSIF